MVAKQRPRGPRRDRGPYDNIRVNQKIRAREVRVVVASDGEQLGVLKIQDALREAQARGLDLVEVAANANPPVCRIIDFGKYRYELSKQEKERKQHTAKLKEIKFRVKIGEHDYLTKVRHGEEFLDKGSKVRVQLQFRGRENAHKELGDILMERVREDLSGVGAVEMEPKHMGRMITMVISPLPAGKRKRRFKPPETEYIEDEEEVDEDDEVDDDDESDTEEDIESPDDASDETVQPSGNSSKSSKGSK
ncbi:MAG: translation initiation factor IF-3 [Verrucomicrobiales bacterium]